MMDQPGGSIPRVVGCGWGGIWFPLRICGQCSSVDWQLLDCAHIWGLGTLIFLQATCTQSVNTFYKITQLLCLSPLACRQ